ncbi:MAG: hypothetical protein V1688_02540 [bacterium]
MIKIDSKFNFLIETLLVLWFFVVYFFYIYFHYDIPSFIPIIFGGFFLIGFLHFAIKFSKSEISFKINTKLWKFALFLLAVTIGAAVFLRLLGNIFTENLSFIPFLFTELEVVWNVLAKILFLSGLVLLCAGAGKKIFGIFKFNIEGKKEEFIFSFGLGFLAINYFAFFLIALGWLYFLPSLILVIAFAVFSLSEIKYFINSLKTDFKFNISADFKNSKSWIWVIVGFFFIISFLATFRFFPIEYDDLAAYFSVPQLYAHYHHLVPFYNAPVAIPAGIGMAFYAFVNILLKPHFVFHLAWLFLIFLLSALYLFTVKFFSKKTAVIALLLAAFIPWNAYFITTQKIDFMFAFISALALYSFFIWLNEKETKSRASAGWLYLAAIFLGYAVSIKMNGLFLIASISLLIAGLFIFKKINLKKSAVFGLLIMLFILPMLALNFHYYRNPLGLFKMPFSRETDKPLFGQNKKITLYDIYNETDFADKRNDEITLLSRQNHMSVSSFFNFFWTIWNITVNQKGVKFLYNGISPYLLIFLPFFIFYYFKNKYYKEKNILYLSIISLIFFILWYLCGAERPWYGIAIFYFLFIFSAVALQNIKNKKYIYAIYFFIILFSFRVFINLPAAIAIPPNTIYYSPAAYQKQYDDCPEFKMYNFINKEIIAKNDQAVILALLDSKNSYIQKSDKKIIADKISHYWGEIIKETKSIEDAKNILVSQGVTHILYSINFKDRLKFMAQNQPEDDYEIIEEIKIFEQFRNEYLKEIYCEQGQFCLYEIKK